MCWAAMESASLMSAGWAGVADTLQSSGVGACVDELVAVWGSAAEMAALVADLNGH